MISRISQFPNSCKFIYVTSKNKSCFVYWLLIYLSKQSNLVEKFVKTRNSEFGIRNLEFENRNLEFGISNLEFGIWNLEFGIWNWDLGFGIWDGEPLGGTRGNRGPTDPVPRINILYKNPLGNPVGYLVREK